MTVAETFEEMAKYFNPAAAAGMTKTLQWNITGDEEGKWAFRIVNGVVELVPGGVEKADVTFSISDKDWLSMADGKLDPQSAFFSGKLKVAGDMGLALRVQQLFPTNRS